MNFFEVMYSKIEKFVLFQKSSLNEQCQPKDIIMKHLENIKVDTKKFYNPAIKQHMSVEEIREELEKRYSIAGQGITCMIPGKYSREYTDYYLNQLAEFFGFDFFSE